MIVKVRNGKVESRKQFEKKHISGFKTFKKPDIQKLLLMVDTTLPRKIFLSTQTLISVTGTSTLKTSI